MPPTVGHNKAACEPRRLSLAAEDVEQPWLLRKYDVIRKTGNTSHHYAARRGRSHGKKVKFSHTRYRALGPELIPVYRQSACR